MGYSIKKSLAKLSPKQFESWFKARKFEGDWEAEFKKIGGKLSEPKKRSEKRSKD
ncbi:hypothetical protein KAR91_25500 [Candidatus Pacearchaeota archaeon]|nr:hypothetical protein [Candidatus Pacearchaeota archaeon]